ncbi:MAG: hypothetical protein KF698_08265 [Anaerolineales bacterium]|nr:hypothetical protein [Anaerolineales bacterium]
MIVIDGQAFNVGVLSIEDSTEPLDKHATRTVDGVLHRELIGMFKKQKFVLASPVSEAERLQFDALWQKIEEPVEFHTIQTPNAQGQPTTYECYFSGIRRAIRKAYINGAVYWTGGSFTAIGRRPMEMG